MQHPTGRRQGQSYFVPSRHSEIEIESDFLNTNWFQDDVDVDGDDDDNDDEREEEEDGEEEEEEEEEKGAVYGWTIAVHVTCKGGKSWVNVDVMGRWWLESKWPLLLFYSVCLVVYFG